MTTKQVKATTTKTATAKPSAKGATAPKPTAQIAKGTPYAVIAEQMVKPLFTSKSGETDAEAVRIVSEFANRLLSGNVQGMFAWCEPRIVSYLEKRGEMTVYQAKGLHGSSVTKERKGKAGNAIISQGIISVYSDHAKKALLMQFYSFTLCGKGFAAFADNGQVFLFACKESQVKATVSAYLTYLVGIQDTALRATEVAKIKNAKTRENTRIRVEALAAMQAVKDAKLELGA